MKKASGIATVSFPFVAGVAAAALLGQPFSTALGASAATVAALAACLWTSARTAPVFLFAALGALCWSTSALSPPPPPPRILTGTVDALSGAIDATGFPGDHSGAIITALLTGRRSGLPAVTVLAFRRSGSAHILALSGLHLGVIYAAMRKALAPLGNSQAARAAKSIITISLSGAYALATGAGPSIVRAFLFITVRETAGLRSSRRLTPAGTLALALTVQLTLWPALIGSAGFQLSYLAMLGITLLYPALKDWIPAGRGPNPFRRIWNASALAVSCQLFTAPAVWWHFRSLPKYFLLSNLLGLPLAEAIIVTSLLCLLLGAAGICPPVLVKACGTMTDLLEFCLKTISEM